MARKVYLDTALYIYVLEQNKTFYNKAFNVFDSEFSAGSIICSSPLVLLELLRHNSLKENPEKFEKAKSLYYEIPNAYIYELDTDIATSAASIGVKYNLSLPDSIHLATAIEADCNIFYTNDRKLSKIKELKIVQIS